MRRAILPMLAFALAGLAGCVGPDWPREGRGGWAERGGEIATRVEPERDPMVDDAYAEARRRFDALAVAGGEKYLPGRLADVRLLLVRARREEVSGLRADAGRTLLAVDEALGDIEARLAGR